MEDTANEDGGSRMPVAPPLWGAELRPRGGSAGVGPPHAPPPYNLRVLFWVYSLVNLLMFWDWLASELLTLFSCSSM